ncbi:hypothetical protein E4417_10915 [Stenotrophomonas maltophilia]|uniref:hypothetical protein n=1 Tax=Stenotrophomonas maltophilia TaxID=40324 RepID=UPI0010949861|nr:hypothetical protein [Stenotrophomonas maltophilia]TGW18929.1 hypothetical protein E4417_10915 [Stenotrophomonas maltophilia]
MLDYGTPHRAPPDTSQARTRTPFFKTSSGHPDQGNCGKTPAFGKDNSNLEEQVDFMSEGGAIK